MLLRRRAGALTPTFKLTVLETQTVLTISLSLTSTHPEARNGETSHVRTASDDTRTCGHRPEPPCHAANGTTSHDMQETHVSNGPATPSWLLVTLFCGNRVSLLPPLTWSFLHRISVCLVVCPRTIAERLDPSPHPAIPTCPFQAFTGCHDLTERPTSHVAIAIRLICAHAQRSYLMKAGAASVAEFLKMASFS